MRKSVIAFIATSVVMVLALSANAFSPIFNVNNWTQDQLSKAGIVIKPWQHELEGEDPPLQWVQVTFDCAAIPKDQPGVMTAWFRSADGRTSSASRAERANAVDGKIILTFSIPPEQMESSFVQIDIWSKTADGHAARGYELSMKRIAELAREATSALPVAK